MNKGNVIVTVNDICDIDKIGKDTKYINLCIDNVNLDVINYFLDNGKDYLYGDNINGVNGFIYVSYDMFFKAEEEIDGIIKKMPSNLSTMEKIRYIYISLGKILSGDINVNEDKNERISLSSISTINNIWGSIFKKKVTDVSASKIFMYVLSRICIRCELISSSIMSVGNKVCLDDGSYIVVNLFNDLAYIQGGFALKYFDKYGSDKRVDKKILYIDDEYMDYYLSKSLSDINCLDGDIVEIILSITEKIIDIGSIGTLELAIIYRNIFDEYLPNYDIRINNFYVNKGGSREHFIVINYGDNYYSYNYNKKTFMKVKYESICSKLEENLIGLYGNEEFRVKKEVLS